VGQQKRAQLRVHETDCCCHNKYALLPSPVCYYRDKRLNFGKYQDKIQIKLIAD